MNHFVRQDLQHKGTFSAGADYCLEGTDKKVQKNVMIFIKKAYVLVGPITTPSFLCVHINISPLFKVKASYFENYIHRNTTSQLPHKVYCPALLTIGMKMNEDIFSEW